MDVVGVSVTLKMDVNDSRDISQKKDSTRLFNGRIADLIVNTFSVIFQRDFSAPRSCSGFTSILAPLLSPVEMTEDVGAGMQGSSLFQRELPLAD